MWCSAFPILVLSFADELRWIQISEYSSSEHCPGNEGKSLPEDNSRSEKLFKYSHKCASRSRQKRISDWEKLMNEISFSFSIICRSAWIKQNCFFLHKTNKRRNKDLLIDHDRKMIGHKRWSNRIVFSIDDQRTVFFSKRAIWIQSIILMFMDLTGHSSSFLVDWYKPSFVRAYSINRRIIDQRSFLN